MDKYKVTLWKRTDYCNVVGDDVEECAFYALVEAENRFQAADKALRPHITDNPDDRPIIYEIERLI